MRAMVLEQPGKPLAARDRPRPRPRAGELLIRVHACGVCRTDLHLRDGELDNPKTPLILGHEIVGAVEATGENATGWSAGDTVGVPWLAGTCGVCTHCRRGQENLCDRATFHGYTVDGGYAEYTAARADFCLPLPDGWREPAAAPLLCAGLIGYRAYRKTDPERVERLGLYGFGASAHLLAQLALGEGKRVYAFTRKGDAEGQAFARDLGCHWAGASGDRPPEPLDAAIVFAPVGALMVEALRATDKGGRVVSAGIHMSPLPGFDYADLWHERSLASVANVERRDGREFISRARAARIRATVQTYPLEAAERALADLRAGRVTGAAVLQIDANA